jgi:hypothetical protein
MERSVIRWSILIVAPLALTGAYLWLNPSRTPRMDFAELTLALLIGTVGIWTAPWARGTKIVATIAYWPLMGATLVVSSLFAVCATGNCL